MEFNSSFLFVAALIPLAVGSMWYNPKVFGGIWIRTSGVSQEQAQSGNMFLIFGLAYVFSLMVAYTIAGITIHQVGVSQVLSEQPGFGDANAEVTKYFEDFVARFGNFHREWKHGALHGGFAAFTFALPLIGILALFERRGWKYVAVHFGYWFISMTLMGAVLCHFL